MPANTSNATPEMSVVLEKMFAGAKKYLMQHQPRSAVLERHSMTPDQEFNYAVVYCFTHRVLFDDDDAPAFLAHANCERCDVDALPMNQGELEALHAQVHRQLKTAVTPAEKRSALVLANEAQFQQEVADVFKGEMAPPKMPVRKANAMLLSTTEFEGAFRAVQAPVH